MSQESTAAEVLELTRRLLQSIAEGDWQTYSSLCDPSLTAFEAESRGELVEGLEFHRFYFNLGGAGGPANTTICAPHVRVMGDAAVVCYVRLTQRLDDSGKPVTGRAEDCLLYTSPSPRDS